MSFNIQFYKVEDDPREMTKTLSNALTLTGTVRDEVDQFEPVIMVAQDVTNYNYMYIPTWGKYYYINGCEVVRTGEYLVKDTHIDVLMTYAADIKSHYAIIDKTESSTLGNQYLNDPSTWVTTQKTVETKYDFPDGFYDNNWCYVLITVGEDTSEGLTPGYCNKDGSVNPSS